MEQGVLTGRPCACLLKADLRAALYGASASVACAADAFEGAAGF